MKLIAGLGNPGNHKLNRHNIGFILIDAYASYNRFKPAVLKCHSDALRIQHGLINNETVVLLKPNKWMNSSGLDLKSAKAALGLDNKDILVIHDDLDLPFDRLKINSGGSSGGHKGIGSIIENIGVDFGRFRVGIGRSKCGLSIYDHVLSDFDLAERLAFCDLCSISTRLIDCFVEQGLSYLQSIVNKKG